MTSQLIRTVDVPSLAEERLAALERRFDVELALGRQANVVRELQTTIAEYPLRERFHAQLMLALYRCGRQAEAFTVYQDVTDLLAAQLGVDPSEELRTIRQKILTNAPDIAAPPPREPVAVTRRPSAPRELPLQEGDFVGRTESRARITEVLTGGGDVPLAVIVGPAGVGKTALAVTMAHELADRFPDGQLFADMRGYSSSPELTAADVLARFLVSLGIPAIQVPSDPDELAGMYRSTLADRRVLILLDNVARPAQVRPVLPGAAGCAVIVTSRNDLRGLTARQGARPIGLDVLPPEQSHALLTTIIGPESAESAAVAELATLCGHLPLALRIAAANVVAGRDLAGYLVELRADRLSALEIDDDDEAAVRAAFRLSYGALDEPAARTFRLLGLIPGSDFTAHGVAALTAVPLAEATRLLEGLVAANLVQRKADGRYQLHDLMRAYAAELADDEPARERFFGFYMLTVDAASRLLFPRALRLERPAVDPVVRPEQFADGDAALSWMERESVNVLDVIMAAVQHDHHAVVWPLVESVQTHLATAGRYLTETLAVFQVVLAAAITDGEHEAAGIAHHALGVIEFNRRELAAAERHYADAASTYRAAGVSARLPGALIALGISCIDQGKLDDAVRHLTESLAIEDTTDLLQTTRGWGILSATEVLRGNLDAAERAARASLDVRHHDRSGSYEGEARVQLSQTMIYRGRCVDAADQLERALPIYRRMANRHYEMVAFSLLSVAHRFRGDLAAAQDAAGQATRLATADDLRVSDMIALWAISEVRRAQGDHDGAAADYRAALDAAHGTSYPRVEIGLLIGSATNTLALGDPSGARPLVERATVMARRTGYQLLHARANVVMARVQLAQGDHDEATALAEPAALTCRRLGAWLEEAYAWHAVGAARWAGGDHDGARTAWDAAEAGITDAQLLPGAEIRRLLASVPQPHDVR